MIIFMLWPLSLLIVWYLTYITAWLNGRIFEQKLQEENDA
jgi:hypothetical protein